MLLCKMRLKEIKTEPHLGFRKEIGQLQCVKIKTRDFNSYNGL